MPSFYVVIPGLSYWCNDLPQVELQNCLIIRNNSDGNGSCIYSVPCDQPYGSICEAVCYLPF